MKISSMKLFDFSCKSEERQHSLTSAENDELKKEVLFLKRHSSRAKASRGLSTGKDS